MPKDKFLKSSKYNPKNDINFLLGDIKKTIKQIPDECIDLIITSPPYNLNKEYEEIKSFEEYLFEMKPIIIELDRVLKKSGSICWQVGNYVKKGEIFPLDVFYYDVFKELSYTLKNRIIWQFNSGMHASLRLSGRYETLLWFTKSPTEYTFNLDSIRVPQKYMGKTNKDGIPTGNPLGKNPSDFWEMLRSEYDEGVWKFPNVKANHPEKSIHPCSFPIELAERCVLAFSDKNEVILDPFSGIGTTSLAALKNGRKAVCCEVVSSYMKEAKNRVNQLEEGILPYRKIGKALHVPKGTEKVVKKPEEWKS